MILALIIMATISLQLVHLWLLEHKYRTLNLFVNPQNDDQADWPRSFGLLLFMTIITGSSSLLRCVTLELGAPFGWKKGV